MDGSGGGPVDYKVENGLVRNRRRGARSEVDQRNSSTPQCAIEGSRLSRDVDAEGRISQRISRREWTPKAAVGFCRDYGGLRDGAQVVR